MNRTENEQFVKNFFRQIIGNDRTLIEHFGDAADLIRDDASSIFDQMIPEMGYGDDPHHVMANSMFFCATMLAVYLALEKKGITVHDFGNTMLGIIASNMQVESNIPPVTKTPSPEMIAAAADSQSNPKPGEFVVEVYEGETDDVDWGMNIKSCAICALFSKYDAMELVPYMCASDDVVSDHAAQGLRRTGTIALGAHQCDFVYKHKGDPLHVADQYPDKIRLVES